jgi:hypothetical protein
MFIPSEWRIAPSSPQIREQPTFLIGQDDEGHWVAVETHGRGGGLFASCEAAARYAAFETSRRPDAVRIVPGPIELRL